MFVTLCNFLIDFIKYSTALLLRQKHNSLAKTALDVPKSYGGQAPATEQSAAKTYLKGWFFCYNTDMFYFYLLRCKDGTLYSGSTNNLKAREKLHNQGFGSKYVRSRGGGKIIYSERFRSKSRALSREAEVKKWTRAKKLNLISNGKPKRLSRG